MFNMIDFLAPARQQSDVVPRDAEEIADAPPSTDEPREEDDFFSLINGQVPEENAEEQATDSLIRVELSQNAELQVDTEITVEALTTATLPQQQQDPEVLTDIATAVDDATVEGADVSAIQTTTAQLTEQAASEVSPAPAQTDTIEGSADTLPAIAKTGRDGAQTVEREPAPVLQEAPEEAFALNKGVAERKVEQSTAPAVQSPAITTPVNGQLADNKSAEPTRNTRLDVPTPLTSDRLADLPIDQVVTEADLNEAAWIKDTKLLGTISTQSEPRVVSADPLVSLGQSVSQTTTSATIQAAQTAVIHRTDIPPAVQQLAAAISVVQQGQKSLEVRLDPPELGRVYIDFTFDGDRVVSATVSAEQQDTSSLLRKNADALLRELGNAGFEGVDLSFSDAQRDAQDDQQEQTVIIPEELVGAQPSVTTASNRAILSSSQALDLRV